MDTLPFASAIQRRHILRCGDHSQDAQGQLHLYWRDRYGLLPAMYPHSQAAYERLVSLPIYTRMSDGDAARVIEAVRAVLAGA